MSKILKVVNNCKKEKMEPTVALATLALIFHGMEYEDHEIYDYCDSWSNENGSITYGNLTKFVKNLGYIGEIVEIWMEQAQIS
jgi:regulator of sigma D